MVDLNYLKRLGLHGGRLGWRVLMILLPVIWYSLWQSIKQTFAATQNSHEEIPEEYGEYPDGSPYLENSSHSQWEAYYGKDVI